jgi:hypothetical protein
MNETQFDFVFNGSGYSQTLSIKYRDKIIFQGVADNLVTSADGILSLRLNFNSSQFFLHHVKVAGNFIVLIPFIDAGNTQIYLKSINNLVLVWPLNNFTDLWKELRYDVAELTELQLVSTQDLLMTWLLSSNPCQAKSLDLTNLASAISDSILAESSDDTSSIKDVIYQLNNGDIQLGNPEKITNAYSAVSIAYIDNGKNSTAEWKAISTDQQWCLLSDSLGMSINKIPTIE